MSDVIHYPVSKHRSTSRRTGRRADSSSVRVEPGPRTDIVGETLCSSVQSHSEPDGANFVNIEQLPRDVGWLLFGVGFAGFVAPGVFGLPFMVGGGMILWPKTTRHLFGLLGGGSLETMTPGIKQVLRFLEDLEKRYPRARTE